VPAAIAAFCLSKASITRPLPVNLANSNAASRPPFPALGACTAGAARIQPPAEASQLALMLSCSHSVVPFSSLVFAMLSLDRIATDVLSRYAVNAATCGERPQQSLPIGANASNLQSVNVDSSRTLEQAPNLVSPARRSDPIA
jgi:hypothetical protein